MCDGNRPTIPGDVSPLLRDIITSCWAMNPDERPDFLTVSDKLSEVIVSSEAH